MNEENLQDSDLINSNSFYQIDDNISGMIYADPKDEEKCRLYSIFTSDVIWTINSEGKVIDVNPFIENCIGYDAGLVIKKIVSKFLGPVSILSCLIELEEIKSIVKSEYKMEPRKLLLETVLLKEKIRRLEITTTASYDSLNNFIEFTGTCLEITY